MVARKQFSADYFEAREQFLEKAVSRGLKVQTFPHPQVTDPRGLIATDVVRLGPDKAGNILFVLSGVHGTELTAGSGLQLALLDRYVDNLPDDTAIVFVHAVNPVGSARCRRTDEGNVDPNRNVRDFDKPLPDNSDYTALHKAICPDIWTGEGRTRAEAEIAAWIDANKTGALTRKVLAGQYEFADGLFYGGDQRVWCVENLGRIIQSHGKGVKQAAILDLHTGLGPKGHGEPMRMHEMARDGADWQLIGGLVVDLIDDIVAPPQGIKILLEFGTADFSTVLEAQRADNWLMRQGDPDTEVGRRIKADLKAALFVDDPAWCQSIHDQTLKITADLLAELTAA